jgi:2-isopropylmalate synthase
LVAILQDELHPLPELYQLDYLHFYSGTAAIPTATVRLRLNDKLREGAAIGDGPVDAVCRPSRPSPVRPLNSGATRSAR